VSPNPLHRHRRQRRATVLSIVVALGVVLELGATACGGSGSSDPPPSGSSAGDVVVRVVDGDTVVVRVDGRDERVRLIGVDTPETKHPSKPVECFGAEASAFTSSLLPEGTEVRLERDVEARDQYDRLLAYVHRADDGLFVNRELLARGYAAVLTVPPNVAHTDEFVALAAEARREGRGLWSACGDVGVPAG
jgi:micrococcal nuclease